IRKLLLVLGRLVDQGNTVLVIEHNLDVIKTADWVVDMGPEGGSRGGLVIAEGTPESVAANPDSYTGQFLAPMLDGRAARQPRRMVTPKVAAAQAPAKKSATRKTAAAKKPPAKRPAAKKTAKKAQK
ncbi:MAG: Excinuclease subunit, partial [Nocardioides sp.]|nr:Excinuclease subunit [Nocardioides sp.]